jgi:flagellar basal body-associated protein FliL
MKTWIVIMLVAVLGALASAGIFMLRKNDDSAEKRSSRMARALALRVGLSVALFLFILLSWAMGWIRPGGLPINP